MGVPAHDERDFTFARAHNIPVYAVVTPADIGVGEVPLPYTCKGMVINSGSFTGLNSSKAAEAIVEA